MTNPSSENGPAKVAQPLRVLIVEDSPLDAELVLGELQNAGFEPEWQLVETEVDFLAHLSPDYEIILSDYMMPQFNGLRALELLNESGLEIPFIIISGTIGEETAVEAMRQGAADYLLKNRLGRLGTAIHRTLELSRLKKERSKTAETLQMRDKALAQVSQGVLICDENRLITYTNAGFTKITGYSGSEIVGCSCAILQGPQTDAGTILELRAALVAGEAFDCEILNYRKDGGSFWNELSVAPIRDQEGGPTRFIGVQRDVTERKRAEEVLRESEERFSGAFEHAPIGMALMSPEGYWLKVNRALCEMVGYSEGELLSLGFQDITHPDDLAASHRLVSQLLAGGIHSFQEEKRYIHAQGHFVTVSLSVSLVRDGLGNPRYFIAQIQDISERKRTDETVTRLAAIVESSADAIISQTLDGIITSWNPAAEKIFGYTVAEILGKPLRMLVPPNLIHEELKILAGFKRGASLQHFETVRFRKDGTLFDISVTISPIRDSNGRVIGASKILRDITERKRGEQALHLALERLQLAVKAGQAGTWDLDMLTGKVEWDDQMLALYGKTAANVEPGAERWYHAMHPDDRQIVTTVHEEAMQGTRDSFETEFRILRDDDGSQRFIRAMGIILHDESGRTVRMTGINWDVTEERRREENLAAALVHEKELSEKARAGDRAKSEFLAVMSHEVRTPLNGILGFSELLAHAPNLPDDCQDYVKTIASSGAALLRILDDILVFSRLEAGGLKLEKALFSCREIARSIHTLLAPHPGEKGPSLRLEVEEDIPEHLWNDAGRLRQVLLNLAGNAIKFTAHGSIILGVRNSPGNSNGETPGLDFFVRDTGPGIAEEELEHIFEPFAQADSSISRRYGGTGLGLSISRNLVALMGGSLTVRSEVGEGSEFCVTLPIDVPEDISRPAPDVLTDALDETFARNHPLRILLVEDDLVNLKLLRMLMRKFGYTPLFAENGIKAVEIYHREKPDCILMDLQMPWKDGFQATGEIREIEKSTPNGRPVFIAALTANIVAEDRQRCFDSGMDAYMNKPIQLGQLAKTLRQASDRNKLPPGLAGRKNLRAAAGTLIPRSG